MRNKYTDLIEQSFEWPQEDFLVHGEQLHWHDIPLMELIRTYGTPLKISYLPRIGQQIQKARALFHLAMAGQIIRRIITIAIVPRARTLPSCWTKS